MFLIIEGLGRSFSGPDASLGSFTPELDRLAGESLYWENFLAVQGRTFAVLSSIFASLPFGDNGFAMLGERMPIHASLLSVLKRQGYHLKFYCGTDLDFDNERIFLRRQGTDVLVGKDDFGSQYPRANDWGYADDALFTRALAAENEDQRQPFVTVIQTMTMHTPYTFPGQPQFDARFEQRLDQLGVAQDRKDVYRAYRNIYSSILYTDDALGRFFEEAKKNPAYHNTVFLNEEAPLLGAGPFSEIRDLVGLDQCAQSYLWRYPQTEAVILRPSHILGTVHNAPSNYLRLKVVPTLLGFDPMMQVVHQDDVVRALGAALGAGVRGIFNIAGPAPVPLSRALELLKRTAVGVPHGVARLAVDRLFRLRVSSFPAPELDFIRYVCMVDDARARAELGYQPAHDLLETLRSVDEERFQ